MADAAPQIRRIEEKLQLLLKKYRQLEQENKTLRQSVDGKNTELMENRSKVAQLEEKFKLSRIAASNVSTQSSDGRKEIQAVINEYIREIDRCIAQLSD